MKQAQRMAEMCSEAQGVSWAEDVLPQGGGPWPFSSRTLSDAPNPLLKMARPHFSFSGGLHALLSRPYFLPSSLISLQGLGA